MRYRYILGRQQARRRKGKPGPLFTRPVENAQQIVTRWKRTSNRDSAAARKERVWVRGGKKAVAKENGESKWVNKREWNEVIHQQQTNDSLISISASIHFLFFPSSAQLSPQFHDGLRSLSCCFTYQTLIDLYRKREREKDGDLRFLFPLLALRDLSIHFTFFSFPSSRTCRLFCYSNIWIFLGRLNFDEDEGIRLSSRSFSPHFLV